MAVSILFSITPIYPTVFPTYPHFVLLLALVASCSALLFSAEKLFASFGMLGQLGTCFGAVELRSLRLARFKKLQICGLCLDASTMGSKAC